MRILTYLGFTLLSILIQFSVMDFIQSIIQLDEKLELTSINVSSQKRQLRDVLKDMNKSHALYYRTQMNKLKDSAPAKIYDNTTLPDLLTTTESTTIFEVLYDENTSVTDGDITSYTTESMFTSTEFDNLTEITFFEKTNKSTTTTSIKPKNKNNTDCKCNFLIGVCDINCCCDVECSEVEIKLFPNCTKHQTRHIHRGDVCYSHLFYFGQDGPITTVLNNWFCIIKVNLPNTRTSEKKVHLTANNYMSWKGIGKLETHYEFTNKMYEFGDPIWLIKNGSVYYIDLPSPVMNSYCTGRKTIQFLKDHKFSCFVKIRDLEMFQIMKSSQEANVISATPLSINSTNLNCSNLHCVNWTLIICRNIICTDYDKNLDEPTCTERVCTNLALKLEYIFNYHDTKITNATIKFHVQNVSLDVHFMAQEIVVNFILANEASDNLLKISGNPGYIENSPVVVSYSENNYTDTFYDKTLKVKSYLALPESQRGNCVASNATNNFVLFGENRRMKCRYHHKYSKSQNSTEQCKSIQNNIILLFESRNGVAVSPLGDPQKLKDKEWLFIEKIAAKEILFAEPFDKKLNCYNIITRFSFVFSFAEIDGDNIILSVNLDTTLKNTSFGLDDISTVVTIDVNFIDVTKPSVIQYSSGPNLNFYLPNDLFLPFPSNESQVVSVNAFCLMLYFCMILASK